MKANAFRINWIEGKKAGMEWDYFTNETMRANAIVDSIRYKQRIDAIRWYEFIRDINEKQIQTHINISTEISPR